MGPEIVAAIVGPIVSLALSYVVWTGKRSSEKVETNFKSMMSQMTSIERGVGDIRLDVAKNYVSKSELLHHMKSEEEAHRQTASHLSIINEKLDHLTEASLENNGRINTIISNQGHIVERYNEKLSSMEGAIDKNTEKTDSLENEVERLKGDINHIQEKLD